MYNYEKFEILGRIINYKLLFQDYSGPNKYHLNLERIYIIFMPNILMPQIGIINPFHTTNPFEMMGLKKVYHVS